jgi:hypothetical protein
VVARDASVVTNYLLLTPVEKKLKFELLSNHGSNELPSTREIQHYRVLTVQTSDPLARW